MVDYVILNNAMIGDYVIVNNAKSQTYEERYEPHLPVLL